jgi:hypothetical protein
MTTTTHTTPNWDSAGLWALPTTPDDNSDEMIECPVCGLVNGNGWSCKCTYQRTPSDAIMERITQEDKDNA